MKKMKQLGYFDHQNVNYVKFAYAIILSTAHDSSVFLSCERNTIFLL